MAGPLVYPGGKSFAFTVIDDTDVATVENVEPVYRLLERLDMRTTKTVWPLDCPEGSRNFSSSETLEDPAYREFALDLQRRGFEVASHGATMESSKRERTLAGFRRLADLFGAYPRVHANHAFNRENLYWGADRVDQLVVNALYRRFNGRPADYYLGHVEGSPYWWGDFCGQHVAYVRNLTFREINLAKVNPSMPYHDPSRPLVRWWFSAADAEDRFEFNSLLRQDNVARLEAERGFCIVATHFGKGFVQDGEVNPTTRRQLEDLARRDGWFPTVSELLDWLREQHVTDSLPPREWRSMQWRWARDLFWQKLRQRRRRKKRVRKS
ncbi:MAG: hypothetical protein JSU87_18145 [Gemmatimonadota bacterium]|nr:MAG: hypothetical protein JSU87_18145 [Gemmatimonadota bacterium]